MFKDYLRIIGTITIVLMTWCIGYAMKTHEFKFVFTCFCLLCVQGTAVTLLLVANKDRTKRRRIVVYDGHESNLADMFTKNLNLNKSELEEKLKKMSNSFSLKKIKGDDTTCTYYSVKDGKEEVTIKIETIDHI